MSRNNRNPKQMSVSQSAALPETEVKPAPDRSEPEAPAPALTEAEQRDSALEARAAEPKPEPKRQVSELHRMREEREAKLAERRAKQKAEAEAKELAELKALDEAEQKYGEDCVKLVQTAAGGVIVKKPDPIIYDRFQDKSNPKSKDFKELLYKCRVYPSADRLDQMLQDFPAVLAKACSGVFELAGVRAGDLSGE